MTDFAPHDQWLVGMDFTDFYFVANDKMKNYLVKKGVSENRVFITGIPLSKRFLQKYDRITILNEFGLKDGKQNILFFGGGEFGLGKSRTFTIFDSLIKFSNDIQIIAISGKNEKMKAKFDEIVNENNAFERVKVLSFTNQVPELMSISDLVISKPGRYDYNRVLGF